MPSETKIPVQTEKPDHYSYLKEFRVEQCPLFLKHKCAQHRPYTCFNWHFMNQRRRRPVRKRDGTFNYSADDYCTNYDETTGVCTKGDGCPYLHRTAGDTEKRNHLRYYKTCMCVHDTDSKGFCSKYGQHCAFAHGHHDLRPPVYDKNEKKVMENHDNDNADSDSDGSNVLDIKKKLISEVLQWQDTSYLLSNYKVDPCQHSSRLCRQGYACPQYHNSRDKRRNPRKFKYRTTPCPSVKNGGVWGELSNCINGDSCAYCHTRIELRFHPEMYKSTKCYNLEQAGYCLHGIFCAFAHDDREIIIARESAAELDYSTNLEDILSKDLALKKNEYLRSKLKTIVCDNNSLSNGNGDCTSSVDSPDKDPDAYSNIFESNVKQFQVSHEDTQALLNSSDSQSLLSIVEPHRRHSSVLGLVSNDNGNSSYMNHQPTTTMNGGISDCVVLKDDSNFFLNKDSESPILNNLLPSCLQASDMLESLASVNIPPTQNDMIQKSKCDQQDDFGQLSIVTSNNYGSTSLFDIDSPRSINTLPISPSKSNEVQKLQEELINCRLKLVSLESEIMSQVRCIYDAWNREFNDLNTKLKTAEQQKDEALNQVKSLQQEICLLQEIPYLPKLRINSVIRSISSSVLKSLHSQISNDLEKLEKVLYVQTAITCMLCEDRKRSLTLGPCNHFVLCNQCVGTTKNCPYCLTSILSHTNTSITLA